MVKMPDGAVGVLGDAVYGLLITFFSIIRSAIRHLFPGRFKQELLGKTILVTGAARGLGRELCYRLAAEGARLVCVDVDENGLKETTETVKMRFCFKNVVYHAIDLSDKQQIYKLAKDLDSQGIVIDVLVNNAGIVTAAPLLQESDEVIERILRVNLMAHFWMLKAFLPSMKSRNKGHIVAISSAAAFTCASNIVPYAASKYGVTGLMASLREELRNEKNCHINTTVVHPYFLNSKPINVEHWKVQSRLPDVDIPYVAHRVVEGIKMNEPVITVPSYIYYVMQFLWLLPTEAQDYWRDLFYAKIDSAETTK